MKPQYEPKTTEQILGYLAEEAGEVLAAAGKTLRWGLRSTNPELRPGDPLYGETNAQWLTRELRDLDGAISRVRRLLGECDCGADKWNRSRPAKGQARASHYEDCPKDMSK